MRHNGKDRERYGSKERYRKINRSRMEVVDYVYNVYRVLYIM